MILFFNPNQDVKMNTSQPHEDGFSSNAYLGQIIMIVAIIKFLALVIPCILTLSYLNNVPTATKCLLLYLYKDSIASFLMMRSIWLIKVFLAYWNVEGTSKATALSVSFVLWLAAFYMAMIMVFISIYELYMAKAKTIDPKVPFLDEDELLATRKIRIASLSLILGFLSASFAMGWYPSTFYALKQDKMQNQDFLTSNVVYRGPLIGLFLISGSITIAKKYFETAPEFPIKHVIPKAIKYIASYFPAILTFFIVVYIIVMEIFQYSYINIIRRVCAIIITVIYILWPWLTIYKSDQLKPYSIRFLRNLFDDLFMMIVYLVPSCMFLSINLLIYILL